jgi:hypothetical protein
MIATRTRPNPTPLILAAIVCLAVLLLVVK